MKRTIIGIAIILLFAISIGISSYKYHKVKNENKTLVTMLQNDIITWKDNYKAEHSKVDVLIFENQKAFLDIETKDSIILELQSLLYNATKAKKDIEVALIIKNNTILHLHDSIRNIIIANEYVYDGDTVWVYPTYTKQIKDSADWMKGTITLGFKTSKIDLLIRNDYDFVLGKERVEERRLLLWHKKKEFAEITNHNPYTITKTMKVYKKEEEPFIKKEQVIPFGVGLLIGVLILVL